MPPAIVPQREIHCVACGFDFQVSARALTMRCPRCTVPWTVGDMIVSRGCSTSSVQTVGTIHVEHAAYFKGRTLYASHELYVDGKVDATSGGGGDVVHLSHRSRWKGDVRARRLVVEPGAIIEGGYFQVG